MGKGNYLGGHTVVSPGSSWFSHRPRKPKKPKPPPRGAAEEKAWREKAVKKRLATLARGEASQRKTEAARQLQGATQRKDAVKVEKIERVFPNPEAPHNTSGGKKR